MRKVLYLSLKEFRSAQKRQLEDGTPNSNGKARVCGRDICLVRVDLPLLASVNTESLLLA